MTQQTFHSQTATFLAKLITSFPSDLTSKEMQKCINDPKGLRDAIHRWLRPPLANQSPVERTSIASAARNTITVLPNLTLVERIALGKYDLKGDSINERRLPHNQATVGEWECDLYHPTCYGSIEDGKSHAEVDGWTVAEAEHLLAFAAAFPEVQYNFPVIGLGSVCLVFNSPHALVLLGGNGRREILLQNLNNVRNPYLRILRVRRIKPSVA